MTTMSMKIHLTPIRHKGSTRITIHTGTDTALLIRSGFKRSKPVLLFQCVSCLCAEHIHTFLHIPFIFPHSWCLMRLAMVQLVLVNLRSFFPMAGYDLLGKYSQHTLRCHHPPIFYTFITLFQICLPAPPSVTLRWKRCNAGSRCCRKGCRSLGAPLSNTSQLPSRMKRLVPPCWDTRPCMNHQTPHSGADIGSLTQICYRGRRHVIPNRQGDKCCFW